jgi:hypothetical protein
MYFHDHQNKHMSHFIRILFFSITSVHLFAFLDCHILTKWSKNACHLKFFVSNQKTKFLIKMKNLVKFAI